MSTMGESNALANNSHRDVMSPLLSATVARDGDTFHSGLHSPPTLDISGFTPDMGMVKEENRSLKNRLRQMQNDFQSEQDAVYNLRKKLNNQERERLETVAKLNAEISHLDGEVTKLRAQLERGETSRQSLEFELAKARREVEGERRAAGDREAALGEVNDGQKNQLCELRGQVDRLCEELGQHKAQAEEECARLRAVVEQREGEISEYRSQHDAYDAERDRHTAALTLKDQRISELEEKLNSLEARERVHADTLRQQIGETEILRDKDERLRKEYERTQERIRTLEESIEAERAAHLETKFNSEIVQLRIRDLENALELEKATKTDALAGSEKLDKQVRELRQAYEEERRNNQATREKLERNWQPILRAEKEYAALNKQLHQELEDKRLVIQKLSGQLDIHQKNFDELKQELSKAKKRQIYLEETYTGTTKEMEVLLTNFSLDGHVARPGGKTTSTTTVRKKTGQAGSSNKTKKEGKSPSLAVLQESLRHLLIDYKRKVDDLISELSRSKAQNDVLLKETHKHKDVMWAKDKALESTQQAMSRTNKELHKLQAEARDVEARSQQQKDQLETAIRALEKERRASKTTSDQLSKLTTKWKTGEQVSLEFLQTIHKQLLSVSCPTPPTAADTKPSPASTGPSCWTDLALIVNDQVAAVMTNLHCSNDMVTQLQQALSAKDVQLDRMEKAYQGQLEQLSSVTEGRTQEWLQHRGEMEKHYTQLLGEVQERQKRTQALADQAWEKVRVTGSVQQGLESECCSLRRQLSQAHRERESLLAACALLCGSLYPMYIRYSTVAAQRNQLAEVAATFHRFKSEVQALVQALTVSETGIDVSSGRGLLRFRRAVLAVMMANRFGRSKNLGGGCQMFCAQDVLPGVYHMIVCAGYVEPSSVSSSSSQHSDQHLHQMALSWLSSGDLLANIISSMGDLQSALQKARSQDAVKLQGSGSGVDLVGTSQACFKKLLCRLPCMFPTLQHFDGSGGGRGSLQRKLERGLDRITAGSLSEGIVASSQTLLTSLQEQVLAFTQRLHTAEVERRDLRTELTSLRQQQDTWCYQAGSLDKAAEEVVLLRKQVENTVQRERFENVCEELNNALSREQKAQHLLSEQSEQLHELSMRLEIQRGEDGEKERTLEEAVRGLTEAKMELRRQEQRCRQQNKHVRDLEEERQGLEEKVKDAESALRTAARDREIVVGYLSSVQGALDQMKCHPLAVLSQKPDFAALLAPEHVPSHLGKPGPDFLAVQKIVSGFVDCQRQINAQITALQGEVRSHKEHIITLKKELSAACRREYDDELEKVQLGDFNFEDLPVKLTVVPEDELIMPQVPRGGAGSETVQLEFLPLTEDDHDSYGAKETNRPTKQNGSREEKMQNKAKKSRLPVVNQGVQSNKKAVEGKK